MPYSCTQARKVIDEFFSNVSESTWEAFERLSKIAFEHMRHGSTPQKEVTTCLACWEYYFQKRAESCR